MPSLGAYNGGIGPNTKRLREMDVADSVRVYAIAGPGDLLEWRASADLDHEGIPVECVGRGRDLEAAAAALLSLLADGGSRPARMDPVEDVSDSSLEDGGDELIAAEALIAGDVSELASKG